MIAFEWLLVNKYISHIKQQQVVSNNFLEKQNECILVVLVCLLILVRCFYILLFCLILLVL
jgi:hypothetical protein